jgi:hypothetical protein
MNKLTPLKLINRLEWHIEQKTLTRTDEIIGYIALLDLWIIQHPEYQGCKLFLDRVKTLLKEFDGNVQESALGARIVNKKPCP